MPDTGIEEKNGSPPSFQERYHSFPEELRRRVLSHLQLAATKAPTWKDLYESQKGLDLPTIYGGIADSFAKSIAPKFGPEEVAGYKQTFYKMLTEPGYLSQEQILQGYKILVEDLKREERAPHKTSA